MLEFLKREYTVIVVDNLSNCFAYPGQKPETLKRIEKLLGKSIVFYHVDLTDKESLEKVFKKHEIIGVIHLAGLQAEGEEDSECYRNDIAGSNILFETMRNHGVKIILFSSSALVYGKPQFLPVTEKHPVENNPLDPYVESKCIIENSIRDICSKDKEWRAILFRYYSAAGADESGTIGEDPAGSKNTLFRDLAQVSLGKKDKLDIKRGNFDNIDGRGLKDFLHVTDLAHAIVLAMEKMASKALEGLRVYNLGQGRGIAIAEVVDSFSAISGKVIMYELLDEDDKEPGMYADATLAKKELLWTPEKSVKAMCRTYLNWYRKNPHGYSKVKM